MPSRAHGKLTIKQFAHDYFVKVNFVDIHGRSIGYDYSFILEKIREQFPEARTSRRWLQDMAYIFNRDARFPVRRRSRRALAEDYAMALLVRRQGQHVYRDVRTTVKKKFPDTSLTEARLKSLDVWLRKNGFPPPERQ